MYRYGRKYKIVKSVFSILKSARKLLFGIILLVIGIFLGISQFKKDEDLISERIGPTIRIASEYIKADIEVSYRMDEEGVVDVYFAAGEQLDKPAKVWVIIEDLFYPYEWEIDGFSAAKLIPYEEHEKKGGKKRNNLESRYEYYDAEEIAEYPDDRHKHAVISLDKSGKTGAGTKEFMTATIDPGTSVYHIRLKTDNKHTVRRDGSKVHIRMPAVEALREEPYYGYNIEGIMDELEKRNWRGLSLFSDFMVDGNAVWIPSLNIDGRFEGFDYPSNNYVIDRIEPDATLLKPYIEWTSDTLQLSPLLVFTDLDEEAQKSKQNIISAILIAISGILISNFVSESIKENSESMSKRKYSKRKGGGASKNHAVGKGAQSQSKAHSPTEIITVGTEISDNKQPQSMDMRLNFLNAAITDISGHMKHSDNNVCIFILAHSVIITGLTSSVLKIQTIFRENFLQWERIVFWITILVFAIFTMFFYVYSVRTLLSRKDRDSDMVLSLWHINHPEDEYSSEKYLKDFRETSDKSLIDNMALRLYKLNEINFVKMRYANKTIQCFLGVLAAFVILLAELIFL